MGKFDVGSFVGGMVIGGIAGAVFVGWNAIKVGANIFEQAGKQGWINEAELQRDLKASNSNMARAYRTRVRRRPRHRRSFAAQDIYGHGSGTESDLNRIPIFL